MADEAAAAGPPARPEYLRALKALRALTPEERHRIRMHALPLLMRETAPTQAVVEVREYVRGEEPPT